MSGEKVVDLAEYRDSLVEHRSGGAKCLNCKHEWQAVAPLTTCALECPSCHTMQGLFDGLVVTGSAQWGCDCGTWQFFIDIRGPYCCHCGARPEHLTDIDPPTPTVVA